MSDHKRSVSQRWRTWLVVIALAGVLLALYFGIGQGITDANSGRITAGMTRQEVEAVLGTPNPLPDMASNGEAFWDANTVLGCRYVAIHVTYDAEERVVNARMSRSWRRPLWWFW